MNDKRLRAMFPTPAESEEPTVRCLDAFGEEFEVTADEYTRFTNPPEVVSADEELHYLLHPRYTKGSHQYGYKS